MMKFIWNLVLLTSCLCAAQSDIENKEESVLQNKEKNSKEGKQLTKDTIDCNDLVVKTNESKGYFDYSFPPNIADESVIIIKSKTAKETIITLNLLIFINECLAREKGIVIELDNGDTIKFANQLVKCTHLSGNDYNIGTSIKLNDVLYQKLLKHHIIAFTLGKHNRKVTHPNPEGFKKLLQCLHDL